MKKHIFSIALATAILTSFLSSCSGSNQSSQESVQQSSQEAKKDYTISIFTMRVTPDSNSEIMQQIQEKLGVKLEVTAVADADYFTKLNLFIASDQMPDVYSNYATGTGAVESMKAAATITEKELMTYMPDSYQTFADRVETYEYDKTALLERWSVDGNLKGFSNGNQNNFYPYGVMVRTDMLKDLGNSSPKTIADWDAIFKTYKEKYPDQYPLSARGKDAIAQSFYYFIAAYGTNYNPYFILKDDKLVYTPFMPEMKEALQKIQEWYQAGYINPEWFTMDSQALENEFVNGNMLYQQFYNTSNNIKAPYTDDSVQGKVLAKNPNATFDWLAFPTLGDGSKPLLHNGEIFGSIITYFGGSLSADKDKLHTAMTVMDELFNDKDLYTLSHYGIEGETYDLVNNVPVIKPEFSTTDSRGAKGFGWPMAAAILDPSAEIVSATSADYVKENRDILINDPDGIYGKNTVDYAMNSRVTGTLISDAGEDLSIRNQTYTSQWPTIFTAAIIGQKSWEEYDSFIAEWKEQIGDEMTKVANDKYLSQWISK